MKILTLLLSQVPLPQGTCNSTPRWPFALSTLTHLEAHEAVAADAVVGAEADSAVGTTLATTLLPYG
jgi:hypothetical protein